MSNPRDPELPELLKVMSHDLKNPLSALLTNLHFLQTTLPALDQDATEALADSVSLCDVLERLITNLDILAKAGQARSNRFATSLRQVAQSVVSRTRHQAVSAGIAIAIAEAESDVMALVDRDSFTRAAENLVANAIEHAPTGSSIAVDFARSGDEAVLTVRDAAPGVPPALREQAVSVAGQARDGRQAEARYGRGLGLLCADLAARAAGARLELAGDQKGSQLRLVAPAG
jgi:K+-sensing histidine kinase KdpD